MNQLKSGGGMFDESLSVFVNFLKICLIDFLYFNCCGG
jgi:hypothetical protein